MSDYLIHYGVPGMKWGVRKDRFKTGSFETRRGSSDYAKRLLLDDLETEKKADKIRKSAQIEIDRLKRPPHEVMYADRNGTLTKEGREYWQKRNQISARMMKELEPVYEMERNERRDLFNKTFVSKESRQLVNSAHETNKKLQGLKSNTIGESSPYAKKAFAEYKRQNKDLSDADYGFYHYEWKKGNKYYDLAYKEYKQQSSALSKQYNDQLRDIGKSISSDYFKSDIDKTMFEVDQFISFRYPELIDDNKHK